MARSERASAKDLSPAWNGATCADYVSKVYPPSKPSPYATRLKAKKRSPTKLVPLRSHDDAHDVAITESMVVQAILKREDVFQKICFMHSLVHPANTATTTAGLQSRSLQDIQQLDELIAQFGNTTCQVVMAIESWRRAVWEKNSHASERTTPNFRWSGESYFLVIIRQTLEVHKMLYKNGVPLNPFLQKCTMEELQSPFDHAAEILSSDTEFRTAWDKAIRQEINASRKSLSRLNACLNHVKVSDVAALQAMIHPPQGFRIIEQILSSLLKVSLYKTSARSWLERLKQFSSSECTMNDIGPMKAHLEQDLTARPGALLHENATMAYLSLWILQICLEVNTAFTKNEITQQPAAPVRARIKNSIRIHSSYYLFSLSLDSRFDGHFILTRISCHSSQQVQHTLHSKDAESYVESWPPLETNPRLQNYLKLLAPLLEKSTNTKIKSPELYMIKWYATGKLVTSIDVVSTTTLADVRQQLLEIDDLPVQYYFIYRGSIVSRAQEVYKLAHKAFVDSQLCITKSPSIVQQVQLSWVNEQHHSILFPEHLGSIDRDIVRREEERKRLEALAAIPPPPTHWTLTLRIDMPNETLAVQVPAIFSTTISGIFNALLQQHNMDFLKSHQVWVPHARKYQNELSMRLSKCGIDDGDTLELHHRRFDIEIACTVNIHVSLDRMKVSCSSRSMFNGRFRHWKFEQNNVLVLNGNQYKIIAISVNSNVIELDRAVDGIERFYLKAHTIFKQLFYDPRFQWEQESHINTYMKSFMLPTPRLIFGIKYSSSEAFHFIQNNFYMVEAVLQEIPLDSWITLIYDDLCAIFPITQGISVQKFTQFLKLYSLQAPLELTTPQTVRSYYELFLRPTQSVYMKPSFKQCLVAISQTLYKYQHRVTPVAQEFQPSPKTPNEYLTHFMYSWVLNYGPKAILTRVYNDSIGNALHSHIKFMCGIIFVQSHFRMVLQRFSYRKIKWLSIKLQASWRQVVQRRAYLFLLALHKAQEHEKKQRKNALVLVCFIRRRLRYRRAQRVYEQDKKLRQELAAFWTNRRQYREQKLHEDIYRGVRLVSCKTSHIKGRRMILSLYRRCSQLFIHAYDILKCSNYILAIPKSVLELHLGLSISMPLSALFATIAPRLQLCNSSEIRLSIKPTTFRQGQCVCQRVLLLQSVYLPKRLLAHSLRFIVEAYLTTGLLTIQVYNPSDCFVWKTSLPWHGGNSVEEHMKSLYVVPLKSHYSLETKANVNAIVQTHVAIELQRHYRRRKSLRIMIELAKTQWLRVQVRNQYQYVHKYSGLWKTTKPCLLTILPHTTPKNDMFEYIFVANYSNGGNIFGPYYIYPRKARIARLSMEAAATKVQTWFRNKCHNFDIMNCLRAVKQTYSYHSRSSSMVFVPEDISLLHIALAVHLGQDEAKKNAALMYEYATRVFLYCRESDEATALVVCCASVFWLATESQKSHRRRALILLKRYQPKILLQQVYSIEYLFYQTAYLHQPNNKFIVESYALFLDILCYKPQRAMDLYVKALNQMPPADSPLHLNFARFRAQYPDIFHIALQWTAKPTEVDPKYIPVFNTFGMTPQHEKAAHCLQSWYKKRSENYFVMPGLTQAVLALETNHFAEVRYRLDKFRPGNAMVFALHVHIIRHEHDDARAMYKRLQATDTIHPFLVCGQVILSLTMLQSNTGLQQRIQELQRLANTQDFSLLEIRYFRFAAVTQPTNPMALTNYALYHQIILRKHDIAEKLLLKAVKLSKNAELYNKIMQQFQIHRLYKGISSGRGPSWAIYCSRQTRAIKMINGWFRMEHHLKRLPGQSRHRQMHFWYYDVTREMVWDTIVAEEKCLKQTTADTTETILETIQIDRRLHSVVVIQSCYRHWSQTRHYLGFKSLFSLPWPSMTLLHKALDIHLNKGVWHEAQKIYCQAIYLDHRNAIAAGGLAMTLNAQGHWAKAIKWFKHYRSLPKSSEAAVLLLLHCQAVLIREPGSWWRWLNYIVALQGLITRFDLAELLYQKSIRAFRAPQLEIMYKHFLVARRFRGYFQGISPSFDYQKQSVLAERSPKSLYSLHPINSWTFYGNSSGHSFWRNSKMFLCRWNLPKSLTTQLEQAATLKLQKWYRKVSCCAIWKEKPSRLGYVMQLCSMYMNEESTESSILALLKMPCEAIARYCQALQVSFNIETLDSAQAVFNDSHGDVNLMTDILAYILIINPHDATCLLAAGIISQYLLKNLSKALYFYRLCRAKSPSSSTLQLVDKHGCQLEKMFDYILPQTIRSSPTVLVVNDEYERRQNIKLGSYFWWHRHSHQVILFNRSMLHYLPMRLCNTNERVIRIQRWLKQQIGLRLHLSRKLRIAHHVGFLTKFWGSEPQIEAMSEGDCIDIALSSWFKNDSECMIELTIKKYPRLPQLKALQALDWILQTANLFHREAVNVINSIQYINSSTLDKIVATTMWYHLLYPQEARYLFALGVLQFHFLRDERMAYAYFSAGYHIIADSKMDLFHQLYEQFMDYVGFNIANYGPSLKELQSSQLISTTKNFQVMNLPRQYFSDHVFYTHKPSSRSFWRLPPRLEQQLAQEQYNPSQNDTLPSSIIAKWWRRQSDLYAWARRHSASQPQLEWGTLHEALTVHCYDCDIPKATKMYEEILKTQPTNSIALRGLALCQLTSPGEFESSAMQLLLEAAEVDPKLVLFKKVLQAYFIRALRFEPDSSLRILNLLLVCQYVMSHRTVVSTTLLWVQNHYQITLPYKHIEQFHINCRVGGVCVGGGPPSFIIKRSIFLLRDSRDASWILYLDPRAQSKTLELFWFDEKAQCTHWDKPHWFYRRLPSNDDKEAMSMRIQRFYKKYIKPGLSYSLKLLIKALKYQTQAESKYKDDPKRIAALVNYVLFTLTGTDDVRRIKDVYREALAQSNHHILSCSYAIFLLATCQIPRAHTLKEANTRIKDAKRAQVALTKEFKLARQMFFQYAVIASPQNATAWLQLALVMEYIYQDPQRADIFYLRAFSIAPNHPCIHENYRCFLSKLSKGGEFNGLTTSFINRSKVLWVQSQEWTAMELFQDDFNMFRQADVDIPRCFWYNRLQARMHWSIPRHLSAEVRAMTRNAIVHREWNSRCCVFVSRIQHCILRWLLSRHGLLKSSPSVIKRFLSSTSPSIFENALMYHFVHNDSAKAMELYQNGLSSRTKTKRGIACWAYGILLHWLGDSSQASKITNQAQTTDYQELQSLFAWSCMQAPNDAARLAQYGLFVWFALQKYASALFLLRRAQRYAPTHEHLATLIKRLYKESWDHGVVPGPSILPNTQLIQCLGCDWEERVCELYPIEKFWYVQATPTIFLLMVR